MTSTSRPFSHESIRSYGPPETFSEPFKAKREKYLLTYHTVFGNVFIDILTSSNLNDMTNEAAAQRRQAFTVQGSYIQEIFVPQPVTARSVISVHQINIDHVRQHKYQSQP